MSRRRRIVAGVFIAAILLLGAAYLGAGAVVYNQLTRVEAGCRTGDRALWAENVPSAFSLNNSYDMGEPDLRAYTMSNFEAVNFPSRDDKVNISAWYVPAQNADAASAPAVILVHGLNDCKRSPFVLLPSGMLNQAGFNVLMIDLRNHGDSQVVDGRYAAGTVEYRDVLGAWDWLVNEQHIPPQKIGLFGTSLGAATVMIAMGEEPRAAAVWEDSGYADLQTAVLAELARNGYPALLEPAGLLVGRLITGRDITELSSLKAAASFNNRPVFITHGTADQRLSVQYANDLAGAIRAQGGRVEVWLVDGSEHVRAMFDHTPEYAQKLVSFFETALGKAP